MNNLLLDTRVALWWLESPDRLDPHARRMILLSEGTLWLSAASLWEMAIKKSLGQLTYPPTLLDALAHDGIKVLSVQAQHALAVAELPLLHRDPFDRVLVAQARVEGLTIVTRDEKVRSYDVPCLPA